MALIRVLLLSLLAGYGWMMGQYSDLNSFGKIMAYSFFIVAPALYFLPTYEAVSNDNPNITSIALINILLGWTLLGWVVALVWAINKPTTALAQTPLAQTPLAPAQDFKTCTYCAESILAAAIKCKHCGADLSAAPS